MDNNINQNQLNDQVGDQVISVVNQQDLPTPSLNQQIQIPNQSVGNSLKTGRAFVPRFMRTQT